nr:hypothetical protein CFP56_21194 [Quercus suber]
MSTDAAAVFAMNVSGRAEIPHAAERARINVCVASSGPNKAAVSDEVMTTAKHIEALCRELSPLDESPDAKAAAALAHWSKTGLSATSHMPAYDSAADTPAPPRQYDIRIDFDIRFRDFGALGGFGSTLSTLPHVEVSSITWLLTPATERSYRAQLRKDAARDALQKAHDYCEVLGCGAPRPVELAEGGQSGFSAFQNLNAGGLHHQHAAYGTAMAAPAAASLFGSSSASSSRGFRARRAAVGPASESRNAAQDESELAFEPQELKMTMDVSIKFVAEHAQSSPPGTDLHRPPCIGEAPREALLQGRIQGLKLRQVGGRETGGWFLHRSRITREGSPYDGMKVERKAQDLPLDVSFAMHEQLLVFGSPRGQSSDAAGRKKYEQVFWSKGHQWMGEQD